MRIHHTVALAAALAFAALPACEKPAAKSAAKPAPAADHGHDHADAHDHADDHAHGPTVHLGEQTAGPFSVKASHDGAVTAGADLPVDVYITGTPKIAAVRFWIGAEDARGSVKAKAELEKDNYHTHVEVPKPLPDASALFVEIEAEGGAKSVARFPLKP